MKLRIAFVGYNETYALISKFENNNVLDVMTQVFMEISNHCDNGLNVSRMDVGVFLTSYRVIIFPLSIFGPLDNENIGRLRILAIDMIAYFELLCDKIVKSSPNMDHLTVIFGHMLDMFTEYVRRFNDFKMEEKQFVASNIKNILRQFYMEQADYISDATTDSHYIKQELVHQRDRMRRDICVLENIEALQDFDKETFMSHLPIPGLEVSPQSAKWIYPDINMSRLVHELNLDLEFKLIEGVTDPVILEPLRPKFIDSFWEQMVVDLSHDTPDYSKVNLIATHVTCRKNKTPLVNNWVEASQFINKQVISLQLSDMRSPGITNVMQKMISACTSVNERPVALMTSLRFLLDFISHMFLYITNIRFQVITQTLLTNGIFIERHSLRIENPKLTNAKMGKYRFKRDMTPKQVHSCFFVNLVTSFDPITEKNCPEVLMFDIGRIQKFQMEFHVITNMMAIYSYFKDLDSFSIHFIDFLNIFQPATFDFCANLNSVITYLYTMGVSINPPQIIKSDLIRHKKHVAYTLNSVISDNSHILNDCDDGTPGSQIIYRAQKLAAAMAHIVTINFAVHAPFYIKYFKSV